MDHQGLLAGNGDMIKDVFEADLAAKLAGGDGDVEAWDATVHGAGQKLFFFCAKWTRWKKGAREK